MKTKKAQTEIIVTVLLVLIALAAVAVIAYFIMGQVRSGTDQATNKADCLKLDFQVTKAIANTTNQAQITVLRNDDGNIALKELKVIVNGETANSTAAAPASLQTTNILLTKALVAGQKVEVSAIMNNTGATCPGIASATITAA